MRTESEVLHAEVAVPALQLLHDARFSGPAEEFLDAHRKYLAGDNKDAVQAALKAFESTMKSICDDRSWKYSDRATAKELIGILMREGLIPPMLQTQFASLEQLLASGLPTLRNRTKGVGHGQGKARQTVENHLVAYSLHIAGSNIVVAFHGSWREVRGLVSASLARN
jgi:hypothetical protein